ncbi:hypothetical protein FB45DRAFT_59074 [Roridomyces roridus]|uniref:Uncharacterized protein n=1 Tax=Roridomyces roridus TaxID=1738132 RepID=A0AAD7BQ20_9AGAR|nr:hypothetical protein FB45DRAFT_59074 [Roridomyces roridus]
MSSLRVGRSSFPWRRWVTCMTVRRGCAFGRGGWRAAAKRARRTSSGGGGRLGATCQSNPYASAVPVGGLDDAGRGWVYRCGVWRRDRHAEIPKGRRRGARGRDVRRRCRGRDTWVRQLPLYTLRPGGAEVQEHGRAPDTARLVHRSQHQYIQQILPQQILPHPLLIAPPPFTGSTSSFLGHARGNRESICE